MSAFRPMIDHGYLSPSGKVSNRTKRLTDERVRRELFGAGVMPEPVKQEPIKELLLRQAAELRALAAGGMKPRAYLKAAEALELQAKTA